MKWSQMSGRIWLALSTVLIVGLLFAYYFLSYVPQRERTLLGKKYRTLQRVARNFSEMRSNVENSIDLLLRKQQDNTSQSKIVKLIAKIEAAMVSSRDSIAIFQAQIRPLLDKQKQELKNELSQIKVEIARPGNGIDDKGYVYMKDYYRVKINDLITNAEIIENQFDRFLIVRLYNGPTKRKGEARRDSTSSIIAYQGRKLQELNGAENKILLADINTMFDSAQVFRTIPQHTIKISGTPYRALSFVVEMQPHEDWILCGLVNEGNIQAEVRRIAPLAIIIMALLALFLLLAMPVLKLLIMSSIERLQIINVWFIGFSIVTGTMLVTVLLFSSHHYVNYQDDYGDKLKKLSKCVSDKFTSEIGSITTQMSSVSEKFVDSKRFSPETPQYTYVLDSPMPVLDTTKLRYKYFNEFMLLNENGKVPVTFANHSLPTTQDLPDLSKRKYFSEANANRLFSFADSSTHFYIQSIRSWNTGTHEAGISIHKSLDLSFGDGKHVGADDDLNKVNKLSNVVRISVVATATKLRSVMNPLLPPGFQFCIVDGNGDVLFHSDVKKNLQENFFDEIEHDYMAKSTIEGRTARLLDVNYGGTPCMAYITPLDTRSMFLITLLDREYYNTPIVLTVTLVCILTILMLLMLGGQLLLLFCITYKSSKLRIRRFSLGWLGPRSGVKVDGQHLFSTHYARCISTMLMTLPILLPICIWSSARYLALPFLTLPLLLLAVHHAILFEADPENNSPRNRNVFAGASLGLIVIVTIVTVNHLPLSSGLWLAILQIAIVAVATGNVYTNIFSQVYKWFAKKYTVSTLYKAFLLCWLFLVSVLPIFYFYKTTFRHEQFQWRKFIQWQEYEQTHERKTFLENEFDVLGFTATSNELKRDSIKTDYLSTANYYGNYLSCDVENTDTENAIPLEDGLVETLEFQYRPAFLGPLESSRHVLLNGQNPFQWFAQASRENLVLKENKKVVYSSLIPSFALMKGSYAVAFAMLFILFCLGIYVLIKTCIKYIYGWGLLTGCNDSEFAPSTLDLEKSVVNGSHKFFIVGPAYSGKSTLLKKIQRTAETKEIFLRTDISEIGDVSQYNTFIVHNFEHGLNDQALNQKRLELFVKIQTLARVVIIVTSTVQPESILDVIEGKIKQLLEEKKNEEKDKAGIQKEIATLRNAFRTWKNILTGFETQYLALPRKQSSSFLNQELGIGTFLPKLKNYFSEPETPCEREEIVLSIEERANAYYQGLWNSCSRKEKHALFDLAKDRFVNLRDTTKIRVLMRKGIIVMSDSPQIMNKSFNNFILSVVKEDEAIAMTNELRRKGSWSGIQLILIIMLVSITIFIALVQQEILSSVNALVATITSIIALLVRFSGLFTTGKPKE